MKRFFLYAVAITALCSACETENEVFATETKEQSNTLHQAKGVKANDYQTYQSIMNSFVYNKSKTYEENLLLFEEHVNQQITYYVKQEIYSYEKINQEQLAVLEKADVTFIVQLAYSKETKQVIHAILDGRFDGHIMQLITNEDEQNLIATLFALHSNGNDKDFWNDKRSIAFVYGAQYSFTQAVLYAGAIELLAKY